LVSKYGFAKVKFTVKEIYLLISDKLLEVQKVDHQVVVLIEGLEIDLIEELETEDLVVIEKLVQVPVIEEKNSIRIN
jgi:hypothetical protein